MNKGILVIPSLDEVGSATRIYLAGHAEAFLISHESSIKIDFRSLRPGEYPIELEATKCEEDRHFPNPLVKFPCLNLSKINFLAKK